MIRSFTSIIFFLLGAVAGIVFWGFYTTGTFAFLPADKPVTTHNVVLKKIEALGNLELIRYKYKDMVEHEVIKAYLPDPKVVLMVTGEVVGCINLKKVKTEDIIEKKDTVYIRLPRPEICYSKVNHSESKVFDTRNTTLFADRSKLIDQAYKIAENHLPQAAKQANIIERTRVSGENLLRPLFENLSKKKVVFTYDIGGEKKIKLK
ncbi:DUF4230 domain-containing protein [Microscilla marina]|uniref:DUF4230 domain-containing protein n=1 Tax=Microscilla marina ATCC 23134 TaxID=313606 RepID=A1ZGQ6_MICM2|nr:DUF4230 domain-containing protein [Microscilla marina]EAY30673.1 hypothetical protein M23134_03311 [Microscilla marina ATCC 23134]